MTSSIAITAVDGNHCCLDGSEGGLAVRPLREYGEQSNIVETLKIPAPWGGKSSFRFSKTVRVWKKRRPSGTSTMPLSTRCLVRVIDGLPVEEHLALEGAQQTDDGFEKRGLTGAVGPHQSHDGPFLDVEGDVHEGLHVPVGDAQLFDLK